MNRYVISGIDHVIRLLNQYPQLMALSSLASIKEVGKKAQEAVKKSGCGCSAGPVYASYKNVFDRALDVMSKGDHIIVKSILKADQICYYVKDSSGQNKLKCV